MVMTLTHRKIMNLNSLGDAVFNRGWQRFQKLLWNELISHPAYQRTCETHFRLGEMATNNEPRELIQIQNIKTPKTPLQGC